MHPTDDFVRQITRRHFFGQSGLGLGGAALASLLGNTGNQLGLGGEGLPGVPHFAPKAKRAIWLFMAGAPSQIDTFDYKPKLRGLLEPRVHTSERVEHAPTRRAIHALRVL